MREVAVVKAAMTIFGISRKSNLEMFAEAGLEAIGQSDLEPKELQALFFGNCLGNFEEGKQPPMFSPWSNWNRGPG